MSDNREMVHYQAYADMDERRIKAEAQVAALRAELAQLRGEKDKLVAALEEANSWAMPCV